MASLSSRAFGSTLLAALVLALPAAAQDRPSHAVPALKQAPKFDGSPKDLAGAWALKRVESATSTFTARVGTWKDSVAIGVDITDDKITQGDVLEMTVHFPNAGATARGYGFRFAMDGQRTPDQEVAAPAFAQNKLKVAVQKRADGMALGILIPVRAFPRFPTKDPMVFDLCFTYDDHDEASSPSVKSSNCVQGSMQGEALKLSDDFRRTQVKLKPPTEVVAVEPRASGWAGFAIHHYPLWAQADETVTHESLDELVTDEPLNPGSVHISVPAELTLPKAQTVFTVLSGKDPYAVEGKCNAEHELRLGFYLVKGKTALRALEWPAATCALGKASSVNLDDEGALTIGYSNGAVVTFAWSNDHFERTEIGNR